jgi:hypothetical protein
LVPGEEQIESKIYIDWANCYFFQNHVIDQSGKNTNKSKIEIIKNEIEQMKQLANKSSLESLISNSKFNMNYGAGLEEIKRVYKEMGIESLFQPTDQINMNFITIIDLLKHSFSIMVFRECLEIFLKKIHTFITETF